MLTLQSISSFIIHYKWTLLFYLVLGLVIYLNRKRFEMQAGFIALLRTQKGVDTIDSTVKKHRELIRLYGYIGIGVGFIVMILIGGYLIYGLYNLFAQPLAPPPLAPVIPGFKIPGLNVDFPLIYGFIALFVVVLVHEFSHGIVARAHDLKIKSTGLVFFGPLPGAFVEPDEKKLKLKDDVTQYSIFAAGPFANIVLAVVILLLFFVAINPLANLMTTSSGVQFASIQNNTPAYSSGLTPNDEIIFVNGEQITDSNEFLAKLETLRPNETVTLGSKDKNFTMTAMERADNPKKGYMGVVGITTVVKLKSQSKITSFLYNLLKILKEQLFWIYLISLGIGVANLMPMGPFDGGRMLQVSLKKTTNDKKGEDLWKKISLFFLVIIALLLLIPFSRWIFAGLF